MENKFDKLIDAVLETMPIVWDNPNGGILYTCPFCYESVEVKADVHVSMIDLKHSDDCAYKIANELYKSLN